ncbi:MAG: hypothetical protein AAGC60_01170 [Acidobacteriota bacterium]
MVKFLLALSFVSLLAASAQAADFGAEIRLQQQLLLTRDGDVPGEAIGDSATLTTGSLRLKAQGRGRSWSYELHSLLQGTFSSDFSGLTTLTRPAPDASLLDLQTTITGGRSGDLDHRFDRASITYSTPRTVVRLGRQALTWGNGQVFHPLDLFNPFSPDAQDTSYKPGTDMAYAQYLFESGADLQALVVPRRDADGDPATDASSAAVKGLWRQGNVQMEAVVASDYGDPVFAFGAAGPAGDALWKLDIVSTDPKDGSAALSVVASLHNSWVWRAKPVSAYVEYHRNGFGVRDRRPVDSLPARLTERIARGQIFNTGQDYLAVGGTVESTPLLQISPVAIVNLNDWSAQALVTAQYSLSNEANLVLGAQLPFGGRGSEFGGRRTTAGAEDFERAPDTFYIRFERFF